MNLWNNYYFHASSYVGWGAPFPLSLFCFSHSQKTAVMIILHCVAIVIECNWPITSAGVFHFSKAHSFCEYLKCMQRWPLTLCRACMYPKHIIIIATLVLFINLMSYYGNNLVLTNPQTPNFWRLLKVTLQRFFLRLSTKILHCYSSNFIHWQFQEGVTVSN